jgi:hypothetical protein
MIKLLKFGIETVTAKIQYKACEVEVQLSDLSGAATSQPISARHRSPYDLLPNRAPNDTLCRLFASESNGF